MDSGNEVVIVDDSIPTTNGINGNHEDVLEMKTRSKSGEEDSTKPKLRSTRNTVVAAFPDKVVAADVEKKDKKIGQRAAAVDDVNSSSKKESSDSKSNSKDSGSSGSSSNGGSNPSASAVGAVRSNAQDAKSGSVIVRKAKVGGEDEKLASATKKKTTAATSDSREDDSGINSRASSVSNEDVTPRMRTRSSRTSEIPSTSTPVYKKGQGRMPLSTYDFDDVAFDEDLSSSGSLKRKAVLYVEEMDDMEDGEDMGEPCEKRPAIVAQRSTNFIYALFTPFRSFPWKLTLGPRSGNNGGSATDAAKIANSDGDGDAVTGSTAATNAAAPAVAATLKTVDMPPTVGIEKVESSTAENADETNAESASDPNTCTVM